MRGRIVVRIITRRRKRNLPLVTLSSYVCLVSRLSPIHHILWVVHALTQGQGVFAQHVGVVPAFQDCEVPPVTFGLRIVPHGATYGEVILGGQGTAPVLDVPIKS